MNEHLADALRNAADRPSSGSNRREALEREVKRHQVKLDRAQARLDALEGIPGVDPFVDGAVLRFDRVYESVKRILTYVALRADGAWYLTGRQRARLTWPEFIDLLVEWNVTEVTLMAPGDTVPLSGLPEPEPKAEDDEIKFLRVRNCGIYGHAHEPHVWGHQFVGDVWCHGRP